MEPRPDAVSARMAAMTIPSKIKSATTRWLGPPMMPPVIAVTIATAAAMVRPRTVAILDTSQPTSAAMGSTSTSSPRTNHSARVGSPAPVRGRKRRVRAAADRNRGAAQIHTQERSDSLADR